MLEGIGQPNREGIESAEKEGKQRAVVMLKPGVAEEETDVKFEPVLEDFFKRNSLEVLEHHEIQFDRDLLYDFYANAEMKMIEGYGLEEKRRRQEPFERYFNSSPAIAFLVEGDDAVEKVTLLKKRLRSWFGVKRPYDIVHASDSPEETEREWQVLIPKKKADENKG